MALNNVTPITDTETNTETILAVTNLIPDAGAMTSIAQEATLEDVETDVAAIMAVTDGLPDAGALTSIAQDATVAKEATLAVSEADSADNDDWGDVIGNKNDTHSGTSLSAFIHILNEHVHASQGVYPTLADGISLATEADDWALGTITQIVPANAIDSDYDIHEIIVEDVNTQDKTYELVLYSGADDTEVGRTRFTAGAIKGGVPNVAMQTPIIVANSRIRGQLAIQDGGSKTAIVSIRYHTY